MYALVSGLNANDKRIIREWIGQTVQAVRAGQRMTDRGDSGAATGIPTTGRFGKDQPQEYRYFAVVTIRVPGKSTVERVPITIDSPRALSYSELRQSLSRDALDGLITVEVLSPRGPTQGATVVNVVVITAERRG